MQARDLFGVALRMSGLWFVYRTIVALFYLTMKFAGMPTNSTASITEDKILVGFYLFFALILLLGADKIVELLYGPERNS